MSKFQELKDRKIKTVGELIDNLSRFPRETTLGGVGPDCGGHDCCETDYVSLSLEEKGVRIENLEKEAHNALRENQITKEQYKSEFP